MAARFVPGAVPGALAAVVGWAAWSALVPGEASESALPAETSVAQVALPAPAPPSAAPRFIDQAIRPSGLAPRSTPAAPPRPAAPLQDGLVMEHGMPMAKHALAGDDGAAALPPSTVALPAGVGAEDAVVNRAGMVTLTRSGDGQAAGEVSAATAPRPTTLARAP